MSQEEAVEVEDLAEVVVEEHHYVGQDAVVEVVEEEHHYMDQVQEEEEVVVEVLYHHIGQEEEVAEGVEMEFHELKEVVGWWHHWETLMNLSKA